MGNIGGRQKDPLHRDMAIGNVKGGCYGVKLQEKLLGETVWGKMERSGVVLGDGMEGDIS